jgi:hypothetical protein
MLAVQGIFKSVNFLAGASTLRLWGASPPPFLPQSKKKDIVPKADSLFILVKG